MFKLDHHWYGLSPAWHQNQCVTTWRRHQMVTYLMNPTASVSPLRVNEIIICLDNGLSPVRQSIIWTMLDCCQSNPWRPVISMTILPSLAHRCVSKLGHCWYCTGIAPVRRQAIVICTNAAVLLVSGPQGTHVSEILMQQFWSKKILLKMPSAKWMSFCLGLHGLSIAFLEFIKWMVCLLHFRIKPAGWTKAQVRTCDYKTYNAQHCFMTLPYKWPVNHSPDLMIWDHLGIGSPHNQNDPWRWW